MSTVPNEPGKVRADQIHPGAILPLALDGTGLAEVAAVTPYNDGDGAYMAALTVMPVGGGEPQILRFRAGVKLELATDAEIAEHHDGDRRRALAAALVDLAEQIEANRLPIPKYTLNIRGCVESFADVQRWAEHFGTEIKRGGPNGDIPVVNREIALDGAFGLEVSFQCDEFPDGYVDDPEGYGYSRPAEDDVEPVEPPAEGEGLSITGRTGNTGEHPIITPKQHYYAGGSGGMRGECSATCACGVTFDGFDTVTEANALLDQHVADMTANTETSAEESSTSAAGAEGGTGPAAPSGSGLASPGPDTNEDERPAEPGEVCTCGQPAVKVFLTDDWGPTGFCGIANGTPAGPCPWCGFPDPHVGRCPEYQLRPDTPTGHYIAATHDGGPGACSVVCACGTAVAGHDSIAEAGQALMREHIAAVDDPNKTAAEGDDSTTSADAASETGSKGPVDGAAAAPVAPLGVGATGVIPAPSYDPMPTCIFSSPGGRLDFHQRYAAALDKSNPGWHWHDTDRMSVELAAQADERRQADTAERPYRCEGCGKTSRIAPHEPGCPVDAAWLARSKQNGASQ